MAKKSGAGHAVAWMLYYGGKGMGINDSSAIVAAFFLLGIGQSRERLTVFAGLKNGYLSVRYTKHFPVIAACPKAAYKGCSESI